MSQLSSFSKFLGLIFLVLLSVKSYSQWEYVGGPDNYFIPTGSQSVVQRLAFHPESLEPYVFFREFIVNVATGPSLVKYNGSEWEEVSMMFDQMSLLNSGIFGFYFREDNNIPVVCYQNGFWNSDIGAIQNTFKVAELIGTEWLEKVGIDEIPFDEYYYGSAVMRMVPHPVTMDPVLVGDSDNWMVTGTTTLVTHYNNQVWEFMGVDDFGAFRGNYYDMDFNTTTNQPFVATSGWHEDGDPIQIEVWVLNGSWESLGNPGLFPVLSDEWRIRVSPVNGDVYVMSSEYYDNPDNSQTRALRISKWDGTDWEILGTPDELFLNSALGYDLEIHPVSGEPYVCFKDGNAPNNPGGINIRKWNGSNWVNLDENNPTFSVGEDIDLVFQPETNYPYVVSTAGHLLRYVPTNTSVSETAQENITIYPNPVQDVLTFDTQVDRVEVFDIAGKKIIEENQVNQISMNALNEGVYVIRFSLKNGEVLTQEVVKN